MLFIVHNPVNLLIVFPSNYLFSVHHNPAHFFRLSFIWYPLNSIVLAAAMLLRATRGRYISVKHLSFIKESCIMKYLCF